MYINRSNSVAGTVYTGSVSTASFADTDLALIAAKGEPTVECGGSFTDGGTVTFTLPTNVKTIKTALATPVTASFDSASITNASQRAVLFANTLTYRINVAVVGLRNPADAYTHSGSLYV